MRACMGGVGGVSAHTSLSNSRKRFIHRASFLSSPPLLASFSFFKFFFIVPEQLVGPELVEEKIEKNLKGLAHHSYCFTEKYIITHLVCQKLPSPPSSIVTTECVCVEEGGIFSMQDSALNFNLIEIVELTIR